TARARFLCVGWRDWARREPRAGRQSSAGCRRRKRKGRTDNLAQRREPRGRANPEPSRNDSLEKHTRAEGQVPRRRRNPGKPRKFPVGTIESVERRQKCQDQRNPNRIAQRAPKVFFPGETAETIGALDCQMD